jgi:hypothetical protein
MVMRRSLGTLLPALLLLAVLTACGDDEESQAKDSGPSTSQTPGDGQSDGAVDFDLVRLITVTAAGGTVSTVGVPMADAAAAEEFLAQFTSPELIEQVRNAVAGTDVPDGRALYAAVVAVGCDSPDRVAVVDSGDGLAISALKVKSPTPECLAPMTTVALVLVPSDAAS